MKRIQLAVNVGADGTGSASVKFNGIITYVYRTYTAEQTGSCDGVLVEVYPNGTERTLLTVTNSATNGGAPLKVQDKDATNTAITGSYSNETVAGLLTLRVTGGTEQSAGVTWYLTVVG